MQTDFSDIEILNSNFISNYSPNGYAYAALEINSYNLYTYNLNILNCYFGFNNSNNGPILGVTSIFGDYLGSIKLSNSVFENNYNGIYMKTFGRNIISNCIFNQNYSTPFLTFMISDAPKTTVSNCILSNNDGALFSQMKQNALDTITNCTFYSNILGTPNSVTYNIAGNLHVANSIFHHEIEGTAFPFLGIGVTIENSLMQSLDCSALPSYVTCGPGNIFGSEPLFADTAAGNFQLLPNSPGINAGNNDVVNAMGITADFEGNPRINFCSVDMGAYETPDYALLQTAPSIQPFCTGQSGGTVEFQLMNGCPPYSYSWTRGMETGVGTTYLPPGIYAFTITDLNGKTIVTTVIIPEFPSVEVSAIVQSINCTTASSGSVSLETVSGTAPFEYLWDDGSTFTMLTNLLPSTYAFTVTDANGCTLTDSVTVGTAGSLTLGINIHPVTCAGDSDGTATVQPLGGTMPFAWLWQSGETGPTLDSLSGGSYSATVTDALGCTGDIDFTMNPPTAVSVSINAMNPLCFGGLGTATASASGGTASFQYAWSNGAMTATTTLPAGLHTVTATDAHGCTGTDTVSITSPPALTVNVAPVPPTLCFGEPNGTLNVTANGGTPPYGWGGPLENLPPDNYAVTLTDANGCSATGQATIEEHPQIAVADTVADASGPTTSDGSVTLTSVTGGTGSGYTFLWDNGAASQNLTNVPTGGYTVTVTDSQGCTASFSFFVDFNSAAGEAGGNPFGAAIVPNPSGSGGARLLLDAALPGLMVRVFDAQGKLVFAERTSAADYLLPKGLTAGTYQVVVENGKERTALSWMVGE